METRMSETNDHLKHICEDKQAPPRRAHAHDEEQYTSDETEGENADEPAPKRAKRVAKPGQTLNSNTCLNDNETNVKLFWF